MSIIVNNEPIESKDILDEMNRMRSEYEKVFQDMPTDKREDQLLDWAKENLIERILLKQKAAQDDRPVDPTEIDTAYQELLKNHKDEAAFLKAIQSNSDDIPKIRKDLELELRIKRLINDITEKTKEINAKECQAYYQKHLPEFTAPEQVHAAHIVKHVDEQNSLEDAKKAIMEIHTQIQMGTSFEELARENSDCPDQAGDLGWFPRGQMVERFEEVVFNMNEGDISNVFQTEFGYHIAKLIEKRPEMPVPFESVRSQIEEKLLEEQKNKLIENYVDELRRSARVNEYQDEQLNIEIERNKSQAWLNDQEYKKPLVNILVKPSGPDCNMACRYCFYLEKEALFGKKKHRMSDEILEEMIKQAMFQSPEHIGFGWQGGEPTLMGVDFFKKAVAFQKKYGKNQTVGNGLQTNGLLIDESWADFLKENQFLVGLSLDGPQHIHDHYRRDAGDGPTWERVVKSAKLLLDKGVAVNALTVLNDYSVQFPEEIYNFHKELGLDFMQFIPCVETDKNDPSKSASFSVKPEQYGEFLCKIFDLWNNDFKDGQPATSVRYFDSVFHSYVGFAPPECTLLEECGIYVVVEHNGDVYSCDFFVQPEWKLGNIQQDKLVQLLNSEKQKEFGLKKKDYPEDCKSCQWLQYCRGGCTKDRVKDPRDRDLSHFCSAYKIFFNHAHERLSQLAEQWRKNQARAQNAANAETNASGKISRNAPCPCGSGKKYKKCCEGKENAPGGLAL